MTDIQIGTQIQTAIEAVLLRNDLTCDLPEIEAAVASIQPKPMRGTAAARAFRKWARRWGLQATDLGSSFLVAGDYYTVIGANPKATKYNIVSRRAACGREYTHSAATVKEGLRHARQRGGH